MKIKKIIFFVAILSLCVLPFLTYAQGTPVGNQAQIMPNTGGNTVGTQASFVQTNSSALFCLLAPHPTLGVLFNFITCIISKSVIPLIFALAITMFVWGIVQYVINTDDEAKKQKGKQFMIWGIIALTVMVSVWGLVGILGKTFGVNTTLIPQLQVQQP